MALEAEFVDAAAAQSLLADGEDAGQTTGLARGHRRRPVIALVGMAFEARIAEGPGVHVFSRHSRRELALAVASAARHGYRGIISFGVAGGLAAGLRPGDWVVASTIVDPHRARPTDAAWSKNLLAAIGAAHHAPIIGVDTPVADPAEKRELWRTTGAAAVDMESHLVADLAIAHGLSFAALRVVVDPADRAIPSAALKGMGAGARADGAAVLRDLVGRPSQLAHLVRISFDAFIARAEMVRVRQLLGEHFGHPEAAQFALGSADIAGLDAAGYQAPA